MTSWPDTSRCEGRDTATTLYASDAAVLRYFFVDPRAAGGRGGLGSIVYVACVYVACALKRPIFVSCG